MLFSIQLEDAENTAQKRDELRPAHRAYMATAADRICIGGPLFGEDGKTAIGALIVMAADSKAELEAFLNAEPYIKNGVFRDIKITHFDNRWPQRAGIVTDQ